MKHFAIIVVAIVLSVTICIVLASEKPPAVDKDLHPILLRLHGLPHGTNPLEQGDPRPLAELTELARRHPRQIADIVRQKLQGPIRRKDRDFVPDGIGYETWLLAAAALPDDHAGPLLAELFDQVSQVLVFADAVYAHNSTEKVRELLGKEAYGLAGSLMSFRDLCLQHLTELDCPLAIDGAKLLLRSEPGTRENALRYLLSQADDQPDVRQFLLDKRQQKESGIYNDPMLKNLDNGAVKPATTQEQDKKR